jgi:uncharacterized delta-60 repeat protein
MLRRDTSLAAFTALSILAASLGASCSPVDRNFESGAGGAAGGSSNGGNGGSGGMPKTGVDVVLAPATAVVKQGGSASVKVTVTRKPGVTGPVTITTSGLAAGVTAHPLQIAASANTGTLVLDASSTAAQGGPGNGTLRATVDGVHDDTPLGVIVAGSPGSFDQSFATGGKFVKNVGPGASVGRGLFLQPDAKIVVTGASGQGQSLTLRLTEDGALDPAFGSGGVVSTGVGQSSGGIVVIPGTDSPILVGGWGGANTDTDMTLFAYKANGDLDTSFGDAGGSVTTPAGTDYDEVHALVEADGKIVSVGTSFGATLTTFLQEYDLHGVPSGAFFATEDNVISEAALVQPDGKIVVGGGMNGDFWLARYANHAHDVAFNGGVVTTDFGGGQDSVNGLALLAGNKILAGGISALSQSFVAFARYNPNGSLDLTFGVAGTVVTTASMSSNAPGAMAVDSKGRILFGGFTPDAAQKLVVGRFIDTGDIDTSFGDGGIVTLDFNLGANGSQAGVFGVAVDAYDRVVISGQAGPSATEAIVVARLWP